MSKKSLTGEFANTLLTLHFAFSEIGDVASGISLQGSCFVSMHIPHRNSWKYWHDVNTKIPPQ